jgi:hypothetical protein
MAHFAILNTNNIVQQVIVVNNAVAIDEQTGIIFLKNLFNNSNLIALQTSYNTHGGVHYGPDGKPDDGIPFRGNYAGVGHIYDINNNVFYSPQPYPSWTISAPTWQWQPPIPMPQDDKLYSWNEENKLWTLQLS